ncbi:MAG: hypothetical protein KatS3mg010_0771 [Acidimicrobiia bacterium]|nr:MAG: hypothetical protein KatS3mg010_0771 [Acidimicrobiia bacterium]
MRPWLEQNLAAFAVMQHLMANVDVRLDGDRATARTMMVNPMGAKTREGPPHFFWIGGRYDDELVRTPRRVEDRPARRDPAVVPGDAARRAPDVTVRVTSRPLRGGHAPA